MASAEWALFGWDLEREFANAMEVSIELLRMEGEEVDGDGERMIEEVVVGIWLDVPL